MTSKKCAVCDAAEAKPCSNCFTAFYCCKEHQKKDLTKHKPRCKPYKIEISDKMGRFMVSTRQIKPGEVILQESPIIVGPRVDSNLVCLGCYFSLKNHRICSKCGVAPVCSTACEIKSYHSGTECNFYQKTFQNINEKFLSTNFQLVTALRCIMLRESDNVLWENFINMEAHLEDRLNDPISKFYQENIVNILKSKRIINAEDEIFIQKICAILDINSFELRGPPNFARDQGESLRGIYWQAALMSHDCISNTYLSVDDNFVMTIRASVLIGSGEPILYNYANPFEATTQRLQHLKEGKYFTCTCKRCSDPTELGTYMGSIICSKCHNGYVIPKNPLSQQRDWFCNNCNHKFHESLIQTTINLGLDLIESTSTDEYRKLELLFKKFLQTFPKNSVVLIQMKQKLVACLRDILLANPDPNKNILRLKINLCQELLEMLNTIEPGLSRLKGITLHELYQPQLTLANKELEAGEITLKEYLKKLKNTEKILKEAVSILIYEPHSSPEGRLNETAFKELKILRASITNLTNMG